MGIKEEGIGGYTVSPDGHLAQGNPLGTKELSFLGDLNPAGFVTLEPWKIYAIAGQYELNMAYRYGIKENIKYPIGGTGTVACHFMIPLTIEGARPTPDQESDLEAILLMLVESKTEELLPIYGKVLSVAIHQPPTYMLDELNTALEKFKGEPQEPE